MLKKIATLIIASLLSILVVFAVICSTMAYDYVYYSFNPGEYVYNKCHGSIGQVISRHQLVFKDLSFNVISMLSGIPTSFTASGSGFYFNKDYPYILTNYHVVEAPEFNIPFVTKDKDGKNVTPEHSVTSDFRFVADDGTIYLAKLVAIFPENDMAMVLVNTKEWDPLSFADPNSLQVGENVYAIGTPLGILNNSITDGIVSAKNRNIFMVTGPEYPAGVKKSWIQHTAHVNPGNSGGPLFNRYGEVIGINTISFNFIPGTSGIYFANDIHLFKMPQRWFRPTPEDTIGE